MEKKKSWILWGLAWLVNVKMIFVDYCADSGYTFAMAQRMINGDGMFREMWEPHQTSAFVTAFLMRIYEWIVPSRTGIVVAIHFVTALAFFVLSVFLAKSLRAFTGEAAAELGGILLFVLRPKMVLVPDYSNLCILFSILLFLFLIRYLLAGQKTADLLLAAASLCLTVLAYPSCLLLYFPCVIALVLYAEKKWRAALLFSAGCAAAGGVYVSYFAWSRGLRVFLETLLKIYRMDTHSQERTYAGFAYFEELVIGLLVAVGSLLLAIAVTCLLRKFGKGHKADLVKWGSVTTAVALCLVRIMLPKVSGDQNLAIWAFGNTALFLLLLAGAFGVKKLDAREKTVYVTGMLLAAGVFLAVALLTNLPLITVFGYLHLAAIVSFLPIQKQFNEREALTDARPRAAIPLTCTVLVLLFCQAYLNLNQVENYVRKGPLFGVVTTLNACNQAKIGLAEWEENVTGSDQVLIIQEYRLDPIYYLCSQAGTAAHSTINTPLYPEEMKDYWKTYPWKEPTVMAVPCWNGQENGAMPSWLREKLNQEYELHDAGTYWNFYFKKQ